MLCTVFVVALVGLVRTLGFFNLSLNVSIPEPLVEIIDAIPVCPLGVSVHVRLQDASAESSFRVVLLETRSAVEDEAWRILLAHLRGRALLELFQQLGQQFRVPSLVYVLGRGRKFLLVDVAVVDAVLRTFCDANLHLQDEIQWCHALQVKSADLSSMWEENSGSPWASKNAS